MTDRADRTGHRSAGEARDRADQAGHRAAGEAGDRADRADQAGHRTADEAGGRADRTAGEARGRADSTAGEARDRTVHERPGPAAEQALTPGPAAEQALTPGQTVGPFYGFALPYEGGPVIVAGGDLRVHGTVFDGAGEPVPDALVEVLQADGDGRLGAGPHGGLFGRCSTAPAGRFAFTTVMPGETRDSCAPHLAVMVHARGLLLQLHTRVYFPDQPLNAYDPVLAKVPNDRRHTLLAVPDDDGLRFDIRLQGEDETVFFDV
ncbi:hypothetical protein GCM10009830_05620 [Glycomyces endophyticus]|uniref:Intradiol ring-cleavage dioxygenases domain-containing protein n=1 Tax=Glycomyces endophyticus TaxID=480996 RepID=A0ABN2G1D1_9ACTN